MNALSNDLYMMDERELRAGPLRHLSDSTIERMKKRGDWPRRTRPSPGRVLYRIVDVREWLDSKREFQQIDDVAQRVVDGLK
jgi:hypothetical protein